MNLRLSNGMDLLDTCLSFGSLKILNYLEDEGAIDLVRAK